MEDKYHTCVFKGKIGYIGEIFKRLYKEESTMVYNDPIRDYLEAHNE